MSSVWCTHIFVLFDCYFQVHWRFQSWLPLHLDRRVVTFLDFHPRYCHLFSQCFRVVLWVPWRRNMLIESNLSQLVPHITLIDDFMRFMLEVHIKFWKAKNGLHQLILEIFSALQRFPLGLNLILYLLLERAPKWGKSSCPHRSHDWWLICQFACLMLLLLYTVRYIEL